MKKFALALLATTAFTGSALAADMAPRAYTKAPPAPVAYAPSWTGCYVGGGGGYGLWNQENTTFTGSPTLTSGGRGYFGTVQGGCDYQFPFLGSNLVIGAFGDYDFASLKGNVSPPGFGGISGSEKMSSAWSIGARGGWLVTPNFLTYFTAGYTQSTFDRTNFSFPNSTTPNWFIDKNTYSGYFLGAGDEYALAFLPGLFWKTEYRFSRFDTKNNNVFNFSDGSLNTLMDSKKYVQTVRSELTYHFNWGGPVGARY